MLPLEISGAVLTLTYWDANINLPGLVTVFLAFVIIVNIVFGVKGYGETEVFFSFIKASAVLIFIVVAIIINLGGSPNHHYYGSETWRHPGAFFNGFSGYCNQFVTAAFAYSGPQGKDTHVLNDNYSGNILF